MPIGGDGTLSYAARLAQEGVPVVSIPKTMDNDVYGTDYCIGFSTAVTRSVISIDALRTTTGSHERIAVVELFGRRSGETALFAGYLGNVSRTIISEVPFDMERLAAYLRADRRRNPSGYAMVVVSEGAYPLGGKALERGEDEVGRARLGGLGPYISAQLQGAHRYRHYQSADRLSDARGRAGLAGPYGVDLVRQPCGGANRAGPYRLHDRVAQRGLHHGAGGPLYRAGPSRSMSRPFTTARNTARAFSRCWASRCFSIDGAGAPVAAAQTGRPLRRRGLARSTRSSA